MKRIATMSSLAAAILATGCTRIETGEVGVRVGFDKQVKPGELVPGSFNQTLVGDAVHLRHRVLDTAVGQAGEANLAVGVMAAELLQPVVVDPQHLV